MNRKYIMNQKKHINDLLTSKGPESGQGLTFSLPSCKSDISQGSEEAHLLMDTFPSSLTWLATLIPCDFTSKEFSVSSGLQILLLLTTWASREFTYSLIQILKSQQRSMMVTSVILLLMLLTIESNSFSYLCHLLLLRTSHVLCPHPK